MLIRSGRRHAAEGLLEGRDLLGHRQVVELDQLGEGRVAGDALRSEHPRVESGAERLAFRPDHGHPHVGAQRLRDLGEDFPHPRGLSVAALGPAQGDRRDRSVLLQAQAGLESLVRCFRHAGTLEASTHDPRTPSPVDLVRTRVAC